MIHFRKLILIGLTGAGLSLSAVAGSAIPGHCQHGNFDKEKCAEHMQKRQAHLHDQLKLSADQEPAWKAFSEKIKPVPGERPNHEELAALKAPERMAAMMKQREARMTEHVAAVKEFYAVLTPEQQKVFDA